MNCTIKLHQGPYSSHQGPSLEEVYEVRKAAAREVLGSGWSTSRNGQPALDGGLCVRSGSADAHTHSDSYPDFYTHFYSNTGAYADPHAATHPYPDAYTRHSGDG